MKNFFEIDEFLPSQFRVFEVIVKRSAADVHAFSGSGDGVALLFNTLF